MIRFYILVLILNLILLVIVGICIVTYIITISRLVNFWNNNQRV